MDYSTAQKSPASWLGFFCLPHTAALLHFLYRFEALGHLLKIILHDEVALPVTNLVAKFLLAFHKQLHEFDELPTGVVARGASHCASPGGGATGGEGTAPKQANLLGFLEAQQVGLLRSGIRPVRNHEFGAGLTDEARPMMACCTGPPPAKLPPAARLPPLYPLSKPASEARGT
jgi:hypothetical protein